MTRVALGTVVLILSAGRALGAGLPALAIDVGAFLRPASVEVPQAGSTSIPAAPGAPVEGSNIARAREAYQHLRSKGYLKADAAFFPNPHRAFFHHVAYVKYDFKRRVCDVFIDDAGVAEHFSDPFLFRFMLYHELGHCQLNANPRDLRIFPSLGERANRIISDFVHLEFFNFSDTEVPRPNGYTLYHETYADVWATAILAAEGASARALRSIQRFREEGGALVDEHDNAAIFGKVFQAPWASYAPERLDAEARAIADPYVLTNFLRVVYRPDSWRHLNVRDVLVSSLTGPRWELRDGPKAATVREQLEHGAASSNPAWTLFARLAASGLSDAELVDQYFRARYGVPPGDPAFLEDDKALRQAIASDAQAALR